MSSGWASQLITPHVCWGWRTSTQCWAAARPWLGRVGDPPVMETVMETRASKRCALHSMTTSTRQRPEIIDEASMLKAEFHSRQRYSASSSESMRTELMNVRPLCAVLAVLVCSLLPVERASSAEDLPILRTIGAHVCVNADHNRRQAESSWILSTRMHRTLSKAAQSNEFDGLRSLPLQNYRLVVKNRRQWRSWAGIGRRTETRRSSRLSSRDTPDLPARLL